MANTLTNLYPDIYEGLNRVSRELTGFISGASTDHNIARAAMGENVRVPIAGAITGADNTAAVTAPNTGDQTITNVALQITKSRHFPVRWNGEEVRGMSNAGSYNSVTADRFAEAMRAAVNEIEADIYAAAYKGASRAFGTAGTAPFATAADMSDWAGVLRILEENGAPQDDLQIVLGHAAMANLRGKQSGLFKVNEAGSSDFLRNGLTDRIMRFAVRQSNSVSTVTKGTGTGYLVNNGAGYAIGDTAITVDTGSGTILAGDIITFAGDTNKYVVATALTGSVVTIAAPGLRAAAADNAAITVGNNFTANCAFSRSAVVLATRGVALPNGGDSATDLMTVTDPVSGLSFEIAEYKQFLQTVYHVRIAWGTGMVKPAHAAMLLG